MESGGVHPCLELSIVEAVIWLEYASFLPFIHFQHFVEFVIFPSISEIQPRRVSWGDNRNKVNFFVELPL